MPTQLPHRKAPEPPTAAEQERQRIAQVIAKLLAPAQTQQAVFDQALLNAAAKNDALLVRALLKNTPANAFGPPLKQLAACIGEAMKVAIEKQYLDVVRAIIEGRQEQRELALQTLRQQSNQTDTAADKKYLFTGLPTKNKIALLDHAIADAKFELLETLLDPDFCMGFPSTPEERLVTMIAQGQLRTALHVVIRMANQGVLLEFSASRPDGNTLLHLAIQASNQSGENRKLALELVQTLAREAIGTTDPLQHKNALQQTPLLMALEEKNWAAAAVFLTQANLQLGQTAKKQTPSRIDLTLENKRGENAVHLAAGDNSEQAYRVLKLMHEHSPIWKQLAERGVGSATMENKNNQDLPVHRAAECGNLSALKLLATKETPRSHAGLTCLHLAAAYGDARLVVHLHQTMGHKLEKQDPEKNTELHHAAKGGHTAVLKIFTATANTWTFDSSRESYFTQPNMMGQTPITLVFRSGNQEAQAYLVDYLTNTLKIPREKLEIPPASTPGRAVAVDPAPANYLDFLPGGPSSAGSPAPQGVACLGR